MRAHDWMAAFDQACDQVVDERILRPAQSRQVEARRQQERTRIDAPAMGRIEQDRAPALCRLYRLERGIEFVLAIRHDTRAGFCDLAARRRSRAYAAAYCP